ncbi:hypothetical protein PAXRUDRAFT_695750 [Paxillus rubicundulus Ve08.2h10]|uniref:Uncharacterized protein n=1 Tax=Paxillus rubicundulus Ve08.2h10 TaxID=930991 RepID=A0A0D0E2T5_9AGAM|nr:hypothetical protein PAXRUDRAFT_695750 [Paxillus rubicundulus Ve08.2h10]
MRDASCHHRSPPTRGDSDRKRKRSVSRDRGTRRTADMTHSRVSARERGRTTSIPPCPARTLHQHNSHSDDPEHDSYPATLDYPYTDDARSRYLGGRDVASHSRRHTEGSQLKPLALGTHTLGQRVGSALLVPPVPIAHPASESSSTSNKLPSANTQHADEKHGLPKVVALPPTPVSLVLPPLRLPTSLTEGTRDIPSTNPTIHGHQVSLVHRGHPFTYDLSALPDDPSGPLILLSTTQSDPGAYFLVSAHYRRTRRPRAACCVLRALLAIQGSVPNGKKDTLPLASESAPSTTEIPPSPLPQQIDMNKSAFQTAAIRPALLLLAACELDISRDEPADPDSAAHVSAAHDLFRAVYGEINDTIIASAERPECGNVLGLEFPSDAHCSSSSSSQSHSKASSVPTSVLPAPSDMLARVQALEKQLHDARETQQWLRKKLTDSDDRLERAESRTRSVESRSRNILLQLDDARDANRSLRRRLAEAEQRARDLENGAASAETRVWGRLKDLLFDQLEERMDGE